MFGAAVWDGGRKTLVLARDRLGIKPLYYAKCGDLVVFGSELKSVLASGLVDTELDYEAIDAYLSLGFVPAPRTPLRGVLKLPPGHLLVVGDGGLRVERYWDYPQPVIEERRSETDYAEELLALLEESVRMRLMADVPLGAMLSGGLDSSLIVALMARNMNEPVKTFSVGFRGDRKSNELADAQLVANEFGAEHHQLELSFNEQLIDLANLVWHMDEPLADLSALGFQALSGLAAQHVKVALSGQGADELLGGYLKHRAASICGTLGRVPLATRAARVLDDRYRGPFSRAIATLAAPDPARRVVAMSSKLGRPLRGRLLQGPLQGSDGSAARRAADAVARGVKGDPLATTLYLDAQLALPDDMLHYFDRASMAHSLEVRVPFLDHHLVEYCARIPSNLKVRGLTTKYLLKSAARGIIPDSIIDKPKLGFFRGATNAWLQSQLHGPLADYLRDPAARTREFLEPIEVDRLLRAHARGDAQNQHLLLSIVLLEVWLREYLPRATRPVLDVRERIRTVA